MARRVALSAGEAGSGRASRDVDIREILRCAALGDPRPDCAAFAAKNRPCPAGPQGLSDQYLALDSFVKLENSRLAEGELCWNFNVQGCTGDQAVGVRGRVETVMQMQLEPFRVPELPVPPYRTNEGPSPDPSLPVLHPNGPAPAGDFLSSPLSPVPFGGLLTIELAELDAQAVSDRRGCSHYDFYILQLRAGHYYAAPLRADRTLYTFTDPFPYVHGLRLRFRTPDAPVPLPPDVLYGAAAFSSAGAMLEFRHPQAGVLAVNDRIFVEGFDSGNAVLDAYVGRRDGLLVGAPAAASFRLNPDVDLAGLYPAGAAVPSRAPIRVLIAKNRIRIPVRFRCVVDRVTNYIVP